MKNSRIILFILTVFLVTGCHRKHDDGTPVGQGGALPGMGVTSENTVSGSIQTLTGCGQDCIQKIAVTYDHVNYPGDQIYVNLCKNTTCSSGLPAKTCAETYGDATAPCYTTTPSRTIFYGKNMVGFVNAFYASYSDVAQTVVSSPGYSSYSITTITTR